MNAHTFTLGFLTALDGKAFCKTCTQPLDASIHRGEDMADIDAVDNHLGKAELPKRHMFVGPTKHSNCDVCGALRIHDNHRGYDYDVDEPKPLQPERRVSETIAEEASRIVFGDREQAYDDPNQNFRRVARMWTGTLDKKLAPGCEITPRDVALMFIQLKISRESFKPQRDNRVDIIGYALCLDRIVQAEDS
jgi:hypothetical protein